MPRRGAVVSIAGMGEQLRTSVLEDIPIHLDDLYRFALRLTHRADHAQDIVHQSVLRALEHKSIAIRDPRAWLFRILYRTFISHHRRDERRRVWEEDAWNYKGEIESPIDPLPLLITAEDVRAAVGSLPEQLRVVVWLSDAERFHLREIAEILGCPLGTVASRLVRGRQELRRLLSAYGPQGEKQP
jgi:RNA polymerase sigma-70 factor, ECF subfamily